jgi:hypothetical protein
MQKKVALASWAFNKSNTNGVIRGSGPSSNVRYNSFFGVSIRQTLWGNNFSTQLGILAGMIMHPGF